MDPGLSRCISYQNMGIFQPANVSLPDLVSFQPGNHPPGPRGQGQPPPSRKANPTKRYGAVNVMFGGSGHREFGPGRRGDVGK